MGIGSIVLDLASPLEPGLRFPFDPVTGCVGISAFIEPLAGVLTWPWLGAGIGDLLAAEAEDFS